MGILTVQNSQPSNEVPQNLSVEIPQDVDRAEATERPPGTDPVQVDEQGSSTVQRHLLEAELNSSAGQSHGPEGGNGSSAIDYHLLGSMTSGNPAPNINYSGTNTQSVTPLWASLPLTFYTPKPNNFIHLRNDPYKVQQNSEPISIPANQLLPNPNVNVSAPTERQASVSIELPSDFDADSVDEPGSFSDH